MLVWSFVLIVALERECFAGVDWKHPIWTAGGYQEMESVARHLYVAEEASRCAGKGAGGQTASPWRRSKL